MQENAVVPLWTTNSPTAGQSRDIRSLWIIFTTRKYAARKTAGSELKKYDLMEKLSEMLHLITRNSDVVGFTVAEYLPLDEHRLNKTLSEINIFTG